MGTSSPYLQFDPLVLNVEQPERLRLSSLEGESGQEDLLRDLHIVPNMAVRGAFLAISYGFLAVSCSFNGI